MARMSSLSKAAGFSMNKSLVAVEVNWTSEGTPSLDDSMSLYTAFLPACFSDDGWHLWISGWRKAWWWWNQWYAGVSFWAVPYRFGCPMKDGPGIWRTSPGILPQKQNQADGCWHRTACCAMASWLCLNGSACEPHLAWKPLFPARSQNAWLRHRTFPLNVSNYRNASHSVHRHIHNSIEEFCPYTEILSPDYRAAVH